MAEFRFGPVELYLIGFEGDRLSPGVVSALTDLVESGVIRLLDLVIVSKGDDGEVTVTEVVDESDEYGFGSVEFHAQGVAGGEDIDEFADLIPPGTSAALIAFELAFARQLVSRFAESGGIVLRAERIPAPIVNAVIDAAEEY
ncbi:MAG TPA: DUF6325 family protein [Microbacterium sp.]|uniref:DUF6325 family protein n=1 Tax=Microbacterium sp. TaxID=51671 RepID=UPI002BC260E1|nr:DUF6325 family protein [Microbacterium sp.]HWI31244.1 DUF6325 family protein [Microbacterium sp.]